jgi:tungstate transport system permease protein
MDFIQEGFRQAVTLLINLDPATYSAINTTLRASGLAMAASLVLGIPLGYLLGYFDFRLKKQLRIIVDTLLSLPTVFIGPSVKWGSFSAYPALPSARQF